MSNIKGICNEILNKNGFNNVGISETIEYEFTMYFDSNENCIYVNNENVIKEALDSGISIEDYTKIIFSHELGHASDENINFYKSEKDNIMNQMKLDPFSDTIDDLSEKLIKTIITSEEQAWLNGLQFIDTELIDKYNEAKMVAMDSEIYTAKYNVLNFLNLLRQKALIELRNAL